MWKKTITLLITVALSTTACGKGEDKKDDDKAEKKDEEKDEGLSEGDTVVAKYGGTSFYEGKVEKVGDKVSVKWADGSKTQEVEEKYVFPVPDEPHEVEEGDFVFAKWSSGTKWWGAKVLSVGEKIEVQYVSDATKGKVGKKELVPAPKDMVDALEKALKNAAIVNEAKAAGSPNKPAGWAPKTGQEVVAVWASSTWYQGTVQSVAGGKPTVKWKDGSKPSEVAADKVVPVPTASSPKASEGSYVLVAPKSATGFATWKYGKVTGVNGATIDVQVQDGETRSLGASEYILIQ